MGNRLQVWNAIELTFEAEREAGRPCAELAMTVAFVSPGGRRLEARGSGPRGGGGSSASRPMKPALGAGARTRRTAVSAARKAPSTSSRTRGAPAVPSRLRRRA